MTFVFGFPFFGNLELSVSFSELPSSNLESKNYLHHKKSPETADFSKLYIFSDKIASFLEISVSKSGEKLETLLFLKPWIVFNIPATGAMYP